MGAGPSGVQACLLGVLLAEDKNVKGWDCESRLYNQMVAPALEKLWCSYQTWVSWLTCRKSPLWQGVVCLYMCGFGLPEIRPLWPSSSCFLTSLTFDRGAQTC